MQNAAYRLALLAGIGGLLLLLLSAQGGAKTLLGTALLAVAGLLLGLGKVIDLLGHVKEGATDADEMD